MRAVDGEHRGGGRIARLGVDGDQAVRQRRRDGGGSGTWTDRWNDGADPAVGRRVDMEEIGARPLVPGIFVPLVEDAARQDGVAVQNPAHVSLPA